MQTGVWMVFPLGESKRWWSEVQSAIPCKLDLDVPGADEPGWPRGALTTVGPGQGSGMLGREGRSRRRRLEAV